MTSSYIPTKPETLPSCSNHVSIWLKLFCYTAGSVMLFLSLYHWKLRSGFSDTPNYIVNMTRNGGFEIAHYRFIAVINQWLPVLIMKFNGSLLAIGIGYSFAYTLAPVIMMLLALHWLKQPATTLAILLQFTLMNSLLFYYTCSELQMGLGLLLLYNGIFDHYLKAPDNRIRSFSVVSIIILPTIYFAHPMLTPVFACWFVFRVLNRHQSWKMLTFIGLIIVAAFATKKMWFTSGYEAEKSLSWELVRPFGLNYFSGGLSKSFYNYLIQDAFLVPIIFLLTLGRLAMKRDWRMLLTILVCVCGLYTLVIIAFEDMGGAHIYDHYYEHYFQPAILFILIAATDLFFSLRLKNLVATSILTGIFLISFSKIQRGSDWLTTRQQWELRCLRLMEQLGIKKAIAGRAWAPEGIWIGSFWSAPNESLFLSALDGPERAKSLFLVWNINDFSEPYYRNDLIMLDGWSYPQQSLPIRYYRLNDKPYVILEHTVPDSVLEKMRWQ